MKEDVSRMLGKRGEPEKVATIETDTVVGTTKGKVMVKPLKQKDHPFFARFHKRQNTVTSVKKLEEEKTTKACLSNHRSVIVDLECNSLNICSMSRGSH